MSRKKQATAAAATEQPKISKKDQLINLLRREGGASLDEMVAATGWLPHTTRAMLTGLRKKGSVSRRRKWTARPATPLALSPRYEECG